MSRWTIDNSHGMGGFLNPPGHPEHTSCVRESFKRGEAKGYYNLSACLGYSRVPGKTQKEAKALLDAWSPGKSPDQAWVHRVLGYFQNTYRNPKEPEARQWHVGACLIDPKRDPMEGKDDHLGVHHIRRWYPSWSPTQADFDNARWGP